MSAAGAPPAAQQAPQAPWGLYVHIPFCPYKCHYCDFVAVGGGGRVGAWHRPYVEALVAEAGVWRMHLCPGPPVSVYYGGGTPTMLGADVLAGLHMRLCACFDVPHAAEVTVECNPGTVTAAGLLRLRQAGVNRLSIGLQATQDRLLARLGRRHTAAQGRLAFEAARSAGFDNVNLDVMFGDGLQVEEGTPFFAEAARGGLDLPGEDAEADQFAAVAALLAQAGYRHYEISNFARPGRASRHNTLYWHNGDYLGLGIGAHSHWAGWRWENTTRLAVYTAGVARPPERRESPAGGPLPSWVASAQPPDASRERAEAAFLGLRLLEEGLDEWAFAAHHGLALRAAFPGAVERLLADGLVEEAPAGCLRLTAAAVPIANRVFACFV